MASIRVYFDMCALKRGWDDPSQLRIKSEAAAVESLLQMVEDGDLALVHSAIHDAENALNPDVNRRAAVQELLDNAPLEILAMDELSTRLAALTKRGLAAFDAAHVAAAELTHSEYFVTTDDKLHKRMTKLARATKARGPLELLAEVLA